MPSDQIKNSIILKVENISTHAGKKILLNDISFSVLRGQTVAVVGSNGAGKTTLFQTILGFRFADHGKIELLSLSALDPQARKRVGYVPERPFLPLNETLRGVLLFYGALSGIKKSPEFDSRMEELAKKFRLPLDQKLTTFSKGMLQKTLIIQALLHDPELLILDEPMSGLDPRTRAELKALFLELKKEGKAILFSSHVHEDVRELSQAVFQIENGKTIYFGKVEDWKPQPSDSDEKSDEKSDQQGGVQS